MITLFVPLQLVSIFVKLVPERVGQRGVAMIWRHYSLTACAILRFWQDLVARLKWNEVKSLSHVRLFVTPWTVAYKAPPSMGLSKQVYWSGLPFPSLRDLPDLGIEPGSPALQADTLISEPSGKTLVARLLLLKNWRHELLFSHISSICQLPDVASRI